MRLFIVIFGLVSSLDVFASTCASAQGPVERLIYCRDEGEISRLDDKLNQLYAKLIEASPNAERQAMKRQQKDWLKERDACGERPVFKLADVGTSADQEAFDCVREAYVKRVAYLDETLGERKPIPPLPFAPKITKASKDGKITFYNDELHGLYDTLTGSEGLEMDELNLIRLRSRPGPDAKQKQRKVQSCAQFRAARERGFGYLSNDGFEDAWPYLICDLEKILRATRKPTTKLEPRQLMGLIARSALFTFPEPPVAKENVVQAVGKQRSLTVTVLATSDLDGDGREDALLLVTEGMAGGVRWTSEDRVMAVGPSSKGASLITLMQACGINRACVLGAESMPAGLEADLDRAPTNGAVRGYLLEAKAPVVSVVLPKPVNDPGPFRVYTPHDGGWFLDGAAAPGTTMKLKHAAKQVVIGSISQSACLATSDPFGGHAFHAKGALAKTKVSGLASRGFAKGCDYSYGGLGIAYEIVDGAGVKVKTVIEGLGAATAGVKAGDVLVNIKQPGDAEAKVLKGLNDTEIASILRGAVGSVVILGVQGDDAENRAVEVTRSKIDPAQSDEKGIKK